MLRYALSFSLALMSSAPTVAEDRQGAVAEVVSLNAKLEAAIASGDAVKIAPFFAPEFRLQNSANRILSGDQVLAQFATGATRFSAYERSVEAAYQSGDVVILMGTETVNPVTAGEAASKPVQRRFTSVWRKLPDGWKQIARQSTNIR